MQQTRTPEHDLRTVLTHWPHLRDLIDTASPEPWPPAPSKYLATLDQADADEVAAYREPLVLAEVDPPLRLHVVDACRTIEAALAAVADEIAAEVQRPVISGPDPDWRGGWTAEDRQRRRELAAADADDPRRWRYAVGDRSVPTAAAWLLARLDGDGGPFGSLTDTHRARIAAVAAGAADRIERTIGTGRRSVPMTDRPCPWCAGTLVMHRGPDGDAVTCDTGFECPAPVLLDGDGRRAWSGGDHLAALHDALAAADRRRAARDRQRASRARRAAA